MTANTNCRRCHRSLLPPPPAPPKPAIAHRPSSVDAVCDRAAAFGPVMRVLRLARGLSQRQLAKIYGCSRTYISKVERACAGQTVGALRRFGVALDVPLFALVLLIEAAATAGKEASHARNS